LNKLKNNQNTNRAFALTCSSNYSMQGRIIESNNGNIILFLWPCKIQPSTSIYKTTKHYEQSKAYKALSTVYMCMTGSERIPSVIIEVNSILYSALIKEYLCVNSPLMVKLKLSKFHYFIYVGTFFLVPMTFHIIYYTTYYNKFVLSI